MKLKLTFILLLFQFLLIAQVELISSGAVNSYTLAFPGNTSAYWNGFTFTFKAHLANTGPCTIDVNSHGPTSILNTAGNALTANDIIAGQVVTLTYDGTNFQMTSTSGNISAGSALSGGGTADYIPKWVTGTQLGNSVLFDDGTNIGVGTAVPGYKLHVNGQIKSDGINETSDIRLKKDIITIDSALANVLKLRGVTFNWKTAENKDRNFETTPQVGVIAQEVEAIYPQLVKTDNQGYKSVDYSKLTAILIEALKEQEKKIDGLAADINKLKVDQSAEVDELRSQMKEIQSSIQTLLKLSERSDKK